jgi:hypothetical protein
MIRISKLLIVAAAVLMQYTAAYAQAGLPEAFSYQAVARDLSGAPMVNKPLTLRFSILDGSFSGTAVYQEVQNVTTNEFGLFTADIGTSTTYTGFFNTINWAIAPKFLQVEIDTNGAGSYALMGSARLQSVPYALYAGNARLQLPYTDSVAINSTAFDIKNYYGTAISGTSWGQYSAGIYGHNDNQKGYGVWGDATDGIGVYGTASGSGAKAIHARATAAASYALLADASQATSGIAGYFVANSTVQRPNVLVYESDDDFARVSLTNSSGNFWTLAGYNNATNNLERLNFYNSTTGDVMSLTGDGNVGIGTTAPVAKLDVNGSVHFTGNATVTGNLTANGNATVGGNINISGKALRPNTGTYDLLPWCMGQMFFNSSGTFFSSDSYSTIPGYTITRLGKGQYCLTIPGMASGDQYICVANPHLPQSGLTYQNPTLASIAPPCSYGGLCSECTNSFNVTLYNSGGYVDDAFQFVIYKVN